MLTANKTQPNTCRPHVQEFAPKTPKRSLPRGPYNPTFRFGSNAPKFIHHVEWGQYKAITATPGSLHKFSRSRQSTDRQCDTSSEFSQFIFFKKNGHPVPKRAACNLNERYKYKTNKSQVYKATFSHTKCGEV